MKIVELRLETHLLTELQEFYGNVLGLEVVQKSRRGFTVKVGQSRLHFTSAEDDETPFYHFSFFFPIGKLKAFEKWLSGRVNLIEKNGSHIFDLPGGQGKALYLEDPAGNLVGFMARDGVPDISPNGSFAPKDLNGIVQIGIAVDNVRLFAEHLMGEFNTNLWKGDMKKMAVLGSEDGMFTVVPVGHPWFPTGKRADYYPTVVDVE